MLAVTGVRGMIINSIPNELKLAVAAGIGLFIAFIGLRNAEIVVQSDATTVTLGNLARPATLLAIFGLTVTALLLVRGVAWRRLLRDDPHRRGWGGHRPDRPAQRSGRPGAEPGTHLR